jgi:hypothetical protein
MAREHAGHYAAKHPPGTRVAPAIEQAVREKLKENRITCRDAHEIAATLGVGVEEVGVGIDLMEARISNCQLGLFGHDRDRDVTGPSTEVDHALKEAIEKALIDGRLQCADAWRIADALAVSRSHVAKACDAMKVKVSRCQLGAF